MVRPQYINLTCAYCGHKWQQPTDKLLAAEVIVYRGSGEMVKRRVRCPNCDREVNVEVPKEWLADE